MSGGEAAVRNAFAQQADWAEKLGSPFMARLCRAFLHLDRATAVGRRVLDWPDGSDVLHDAVPLRIAGGLHALVRRGALPDLARLYPPNPLPGEDELWAAVREALVSAEGELLPWLDSAPQTNEVSRSAVLMAGYATLARITGRPIAILELGASAGLNLLADRYRSRLGTLELGDPVLPLTLAPDWSGPNPPEAGVSLLARRGVDLNPLDVTRPADRERMLAYVWPDQADRLARMETALSIARADPPRLDRGDAASWLEQRLHEPAPEGVVRTVVHTIAFQYFPDATRARIYAALEEAGRAARTETPFAWLRYEADPAFDGKATLRLRVWPDGSDRLLAVGDGHVRRVKWLLGSEAAR